MNSLSDSKTESLFSAAKTLGAEPFLNKFGEMDKVSKMEDKLKIFGQGTLFSIYSSILGGVDD